LIIQNLHEIKQVPSVVTIGTFDGLHRGHHRIISEVIESKARIGLRSVLITFEPHPQQILFPERSLKILMSLEEKLEVLSRFDLDIVLIAEFDEDLAQMSGSDFIKQVLTDKIGMKHCVIGYDHAFGKNRSGNYETLVRLSRKLGFEVTRIEPFTDENIPVSSSVIRELLERGDVEAASKHLGYEYFMIGTVRRGDGRGKQLGFPTAIPPRTSA